MMMNEIHPPGRPAPRMSKHAAVRTQQRCIPQLFLDALLDWGDRKKAGARASSYCFSKRGWRRFGQYVGLEARQFERVRNAYIVVAGDGTIITACWRH